MNMINFGLFYIHTSIIN